MSTLGGNVATNAGGLHGLKYGNTGGYVLGVQAVLADGEIIRAGGRLLKDVAGYDLVRLLTGSEGTLAVLTELTLALRPAPAASTTGLAYFADLESASDAVRGVIARRHPPATLEFLDATVHPGRRGVRPTSAWTRRPGRMLLFGDDGSDAEVDRTVTAMAEVMREHGASSVQVATAAAESEALLAARRCALPALSRLGGATMLEDVGVPRSRLPELVRRIDAIAERHEVTIATFGHAGDGNAHPVGCFDPGRSRRSAHGSRPPSTTSSPPRSSWAAPSPASTASARRSCPTSRHSSARRRPRCWPGSSAPSTRRASSTPESSDHDRPAASSTPTDLGTCISCGFCLPACPTYQLTGDEASSPRGRIALMRAIDDGTVDVFDAAAREQGSFCLGCRACEPVCPGRRPLRPAPRRPPRRPVEGTPPAAADPAAADLRRRAAGSSGSPADSAGTPGSPPRGPVAGRPRRHVDARLLRAGPVPRGEPRRRRAPCPASGSRATRAAAARCTPTTGTWPAASNSPRQLADRPGRIVSTAGGCAAHLAAVAGRDRVLDYSEALLERGRLPGPILVDGRPARIGLQDSCHLRNGLGVSAAPRTVLGALGDYVEIPGAGDCCGAAGTYAILRRRDSRRVLAAKLAALADLDLDFLVVVNPGCQRQLMTAVVARVCAPGCVHLAELVAAAQADHGR